jgi:phosphoglycerate dehydrogenase-like enzyme
VTDAGEVLVTWPGFALDGAAAKRLRAAGLRPRVDPKTGARTPADVERLAKGVVAAIVSTDPFDRAVLASAEHLRVIARVGIGTDAIDLEAATDVGVVVTITPGANQETTADHAVAMMLAGLRRIVEHDASVRRGEWERGTALTPWDVHGVIVGLVCYGAIGRAVAQRIEGFGARLLVCDPAVEQLDAGELVTLPELLERADVVSLHVPLTAATQDLIGSAELARMRPGAMLVNTSRGALVDETALAAALTGGRLRAAALDVFADEPEVSPALRRLPNVTLTPHIAGLSTQSIARMLEMATDSVLAVLRGRIDPALVANPEVLGLPEAIA